MPRTGNVRTSRLLCNRRGAGHGPCRGRPAAGPHSAPADPPALIRQVAEAGIARTVGIACSQEKQAGFYGTGAVITPDGYIITSTTVVPAGADEIKVYFDGPKVLKAQDRRKQQGTGGDVAEGRCQGPRLLPRGTRNARRRPAGIHLQQRPRHDADGQPGLFQHGSGQRRL